MAKLPPANCKLCRSGKVCNSCMINGFMQRAEEVANNPVISPLRGMEFEHGKI